MLQNYQLLSAGIAANAFFTASIDGAAFGPTDPAPTGATALRRQVRQLAAPHAASVGDYHYEQGLGFAGSAKINAALPPDQQKQYADIERDMMQKLRQRTAQ